MSRARHRAKGGKVVAYAGGGSNVMDEAHRTENIPGKKRGGRHFGDGEAAKDHGAKRARGGAVHHGKHHVSHHHHHAKGGIVHVHHHHRKRGGAVAGRARGGAIGSDKRPLSSAANVKFLPETRGGGKGAGPANEQS